MTKQRLLLRIALVVSVGWTSVAAWSAVEPRTQEPTKTSARDVIEMTRILSPIDDETNPAYRSPSGRWLVVHTRSSDTQTNVITEKLLVFDAHRLDESLAANRPLPVPRELAVIHRTKDDTNIQRLTWPSPDTLSFIAEGSGGVKQGFVSHLIPGTTEQVTHSPTDVESFATNGSTVVLYRRVPISAPPTVVEVVQTGWEIFPPDPSSQPFQLSVSQGRIETNIGGPVSAGDRPLWLSPDGRHAIVVAPAVLAPAHWKDLEVIDPEWSWTPDKVRADPTSPDLLLRERYVLVDITAGTSKPLLDGPIALTSYAVAPREAFWVPERNSVIVSHTWLPLRGVNQEEFRRRRKYPAIAEISLSSGQVTPILYEPDGMPRAGEDAPRRYLDTIKLLDPDTLAISYRLKGPVYKSEKLRRAWDGKWKSYGLLEETQSQSFGVSVVQKQGLNTRPRLFAVGELCKCERPLLDPAPQAENFKFGRVEELTWMDENATEWRGLLVQPVNYVGGRKYPLVVQTHGYRRGAFLLDGGGTDSGTAMAAQALANEGFFVLQVQDSPAAAGTNDRNEASLNAEGFRSGIQNLIKRSDIDSKNIGIIAFSRTGLSVPVLMAEDPDLIKAAIFADTGWWTYTGQLAYVGTSIRALAEQAIRVQGGWTAADDPKDWFAQSPLYKIIDGKAAIRIEGTSGRPSVQSHWEYYALLKARRKPVDFVYYPSGSHELQKPLEKLASQQGTVDWFSFWLQDRQIEPAAKVAQYARWKDLKKKIAPARVSQP